jgi:hypothetical protein
MKTPKYTALNATVKWEQKCAAINYAVKKEISLSNVIRQALELFLGKVK